MQYRRILALLMVFSLLCPTSALTADSTAPSQESGQDIIKWVDFTIPAAIMKKAMELDIQSHEQGGGATLCWIEMLAYVGAKRGGDFKKAKARDFETLAQTLSQGTSMAELTAELKYYDYYHRAYTAVLGGLLGAYETGVTQEDGSVTWEKHYGLRAYHPLAKGYDFSHYDDFGNGRSYGYKRKHLGHDMMALTGTPIAAVESGIVEELGWNQYGGWRVGIRSFDGLRYWYYAHMRQNRPYAEGLTKGQTVTAGDIIGYVGRTGYSSQENKNNIKQSHLHWGLQLIFDPAQKDGVNQIWIDLYEISKLLGSRRVETVRNPDTKEHTRAQPYREIESPVPTGEAALVSAVGEGAEDGEIYKKDKRKTVPVPILMYHDILKDPARQNTYVISPEALESDLKWLYNNGYHTVGVQDIIDYVEKGAMLPPKPVMLTFDDGHYNNVHYAEPLLQKYEMKGVMFVVGALCDRAVAEGERNPNYSYVMWEELGRMSQSGLWEIHGHTYDLHHDKQGWQGVAQRWGESEESYQARLQEDFSRMTERITQSTGIPPLGFAYPFGVCGERAELVLGQLGYKATFCSRDGIAELQMGQPDSLRLLRRRVRTPGKPASRLTVDS